MLFLTPKTNENEAAETGPAIQLNAMKFPSKSPLTDIYKVISHRMSFWSLAFSLFVLLNKWTFPQRLFPEGFRHTFGFKNSPNWNGIPKWNKDVKAIYERKFTYKMWRPKGVKQSLELAARLDKNKETSKAVPGRIKGGRGEESQQQRGRGGQGSLLILYKTGEERSEWVREAAMGRKL